jgi:putative redox protein
LANQQPNHHVTAVWRGERWTFDATTTTGHSVVMDGLHEAQDDGPTPIELLLTALSGCTGVTVLSILQKKREPVTGLEVHVDGQRAEEHPRVYTHIDVTYRVYGDVKRESVERAIELSETKYCGVSAMLSKVTTMTHTFAILPRS